MLLYFISAILIGLLFAFAFSSFFNFFALFAICFSVVFFVGLFIHTAVKDCNPLIHALGAVWETLGIWFLIAYPILFSVTAVLFVVGAVTAPIWYCIEEKNALYDFFSVMDEDNVWLVVFILVAAMLVAILAFGGVLLFNPLLIYRLLHFGWIIAIFIVAAIIGLTLAIILLVKFEYTYTANRILAIGSVIASVLLIPVLITGLVRSSNATYYMYYAEDFYALVNAPISDKTVFVLKVDMEFEEDELGWFGKQQDFTGIFEGEGHSITVQAEFNEPLFGEYDFYFGFVARNKGTIRNVVFKDCRITLSGECTPEYFGLIAGSNYYGTILNCEVIDCQVKSASTIEKHSLTSYNGKIENTTVENPNYDESFYGEGWYKIG